MRGEDREVNRPDDPFTGEPRRAKAKIIGSQGVMGKIAREKYSRDARGSQHTCSVTRYLLSSDEIESNDQKKPAGRIQRRIEMGKNVEKIHLFPESEKQE